MEINIEYDEGLDQLMFIQALDHSAATRILVELCKDCGLVERITAMAMAALSAIDAHEIEEEVFKSLNAIQIEELWDNSGKTRLGYQDATEVAYEMVGDALYYVLEKMEQYKTLGMKAEEKACCKGIISGLLKYGEQGNNEFHDWVPDDPYTYVEDILNDWKKDNSVEDIAEVQMVYDSHFSETDVEIQEHEQINKERTTSDYEEFEREQTIVREINELHLSGFKKWLKSSGLSAKTIERHVSNVDFYINDYLCYYDARDVQQGCYCVGQFLGDWFIRKTPASCTGIKSSAASFKKFYAYLLVVNVIEQRDYNALCSDINDGLPDWLDEMKRYDEMLESDDFW